MKRISLDQVARKLGVSKTLVSLVLNGKGDLHGISKKTQERVIRESRELNYQPNVIAKGLRTGRSNVIGLVVADIGNPFYSKIARRVEDMMRKEQYHLLVCSSEEDPEDEKQSIDFLVQSQRVSGLIIATTLKERKYFQSLQKSGLPFVLIDRHLEGLDCDRVTVSNYEGAFEATEHLIKTGYKKIGFLSITPSHLSSVNDRKRGYREALRKHRIPFSDDMMQEVEFEKVDQVMPDIVRKIIQPPNALEAVITANNSLAVQLLETVQEKGLRIPQDLALISFDDIDLFRLSYPPVTAVAQPVEEIGTEAVKILFERIKNTKRKTKTRSVILPTKLVIRKSCGQFLKKI